MNYDRHKINEHTFGIDNDGKSKVNSTIKRINDDSLMEVQFYTGSLHDAAQLNHALKFCTIIEIEIKPIDMIMLCPQCGRQHIDNSQPEKEWTNPPHKTHQCQYCSHEWRPCNYPTNGVEKL